MQARCNRAISPLAATSNNSPSLPQKVQAFGFAREASAPSAASAAPSSFATCSPPWGVSQTETSKQSLSPKGFWDFESETASSGVSLLFCKKCPLLLACFVVSLSEGR
jgi:hypothetical protein